MTMGPSSGSSRRVSRRTILIGTAAVVAGAGGGIAAGELRSLHPHDSGNPAPVDVVATLAYERTLIAQLDFAVAHGSLPQATAAGIRADHAAHADALAGALATYAPAVVPEAAVPNSAASRAELRSAESAASTRAAHIAAAQQDATLATLMASIAASEATHAAVLR